MGMRISNLRTCKQCANYDDPSCIHTDNNILALFSRCGAEAAKNCSEFISESSARVHRINNNEALKFLLAGDSEFIIESGKTGKKFRLKLEKKESSLYKSDEADNGKDIYWLYVELPNGILNYAGVIYYSTQDNKYTFGKGSRGNIDKSDVRVVSILFILNHLHNRDYSINVSIYHLGRCGGCGDILIDKLGVETGLEYKCRNRKDLEVYNG